MDTDPAYDIGNPGTPRATWRSRLLPVAHIAAVTAVVTVAALLAVRPTGQPQPRYYTGAADDRTFIIGANEDITVQGIALSPDGTMLAVSLRYQVPLSVDSLHYGGIEVINLATGTTRTWMSHGWYYWPGPPSWVDGDRMVAFTWWHDIGTTGPTVLAGIRQLDTTAPGSDLLDSSRAATST